MDLKTAQELMEIYHKGKFEKISVTPKFIANLIEAATLTEQARCASIVNQYMCKSTVEEYKGGGLRRIMMSEIVNPRQDNSSSP